LEVGCGTGDLLDEACRRAGADHATGIGIDLSEHLVARAAERFPQYEFRVADGEQLPFDSQSFDLVFIATVLVHSGAPENILREAARVVKPGGIVAALDQDFETATLYPGQKDLTRRVLNAANDFWENGWIGRRLPSLFRGAGMRYIGVDCFVRIDRTLDAGFFRRIRDWIIESGFPESEAKAWYEELCANATRDEFIFTRNFFSVTGTK
jgi:ubiquinone/menaquinone biosynthesis C-methylase UbiE